MSSLFAQSELNDLLEKVERGERLNVDAGIRMMNSQDILALGYMANLVRERKHGHKTFFRVTGLMQDTSVIANLREHAHQADLSEIHLKTIKFSPEIPLEHHLEMLAQVSKERYLEIHETAHRSGMQTDVTMLYGNIESIEDRIEDLLMLRELQDRTSGFRSFLPLYYKRKNVDETMGFEDSTGFEDLKVIAVSRILLDNIEHIKAFGSVLGPKLTQVSLNFGVDHLDSPVLTKKALIHIIEKAGREAVEQEYS